MCGTRRYARNFLASQTACLALSKIWRPSKMWAPLNVAFRMLSSILSRRRPERSPNPLAILSSSHNTSERPCPVKKLWTTPRCFSLIWCQTLQNSKEAHSRDKILECLQLLRSQRRRRDIFHNLRLVSRLSRDLSRVRGLAHLQFRRIVMNWGWLALRHLKLVY